MEVGKLTVQRRHDSGKGLARKLRAQGMIPGVCYGFDIDGALPITVDVRELRGSLDPTKRVNTVIDMTIEDKGEVERVVTVMVKDYQIQKIRRDLLHVDLIAIDREAEVLADVPVVYEGKAVGTVTGGQLHVVRRSIEVRCKPADIPPRVVLDITELDNGGVFHVSDLELPEGVILESPGHFTLITCSAAEVEETEEGEEGEEAEATPAS